VAATDGEGALAWADSIAGDGTRTVAREEAARAMLRAQGDSARQVLAAAGFSDEQIAGFSKNSEIALYKDAMVLSSNNLTFARSWVDATALAEQQRELELVVQRRAELELADKFINDSWQTGGSAVVGFDQDSGRVLPAGRQTGDAAYQNAHPGGAPANCASCHQ
jgi:hypothetical protein